MGSDEGKSAAVTMSNYTVSGTGRVTARRTRTRGAVVNNQ